PPRLITSSFQPRAHTLHADSFPTRRSSDLDDLSRHRRLQAATLVARSRDARGAEYPRDLRSQGDGLQQRALHPHGVQGDEPRVRSEEHTSELQSHLNLVCRLLLEKKKQIHP